ncbi:hypothetical protein G4B88_002092 [Cannabis sativa]|uniref:Phorbol-ester/DAG-type domain-containing protein n=1 Tax=Cannabis sativa TaxID=3483 RepID=A0A7J6EYB5_CANSA|nr:hypothetical protein G4B88_002092 [Cannabis sativa]
MSPYLQHHTHDHPLIQIDDFGSRYTSAVQIYCSLCELMIDRNQTCYDCSSSCLYSLHKVCAELPQYVDHGLHPHHGRLMLGKRSSDHTTTCYYCDTSFQTQQTLAYKCTQCSLHMHTSCALIPIPTLRCNDDKDNNVRYFCHQRSMNLVEHDDSKNHAKCFVCQSAWSNSAYSCSFPNCKNFLHYSCANFQSKTDQHPSHSHHPLILQFKCIVPKIIVRCQSHDHSLSFVEKAFYEGVCNACEKSYTQWSSECFVPKEVKRTQSFLFRCVECDFNLHFLCGPLPSIIKFDYHIHSLTLVDHYITKDGHNDEFYCDICEEERDPYIRIYCCKDCDFAAHIHCLLIEFLTDTLTDQDKALLSDPFTFGYSSDVKTYVDQMYKSCTQANYLLFDNQFRSSIEKIYQINHFPSFTSNDYQNFFSELLLYRPKEGLKLDEKYLRQKVVDIKGYKVPLTLAHILNTLLHQYTESDLFGESVWNWTPGIKSVFATTFCMVCDQMCRTNINDVTKHLLQDWFFYLNAIVGNRYEKDIKEKLQGRITDLEAELNKCKEKLDMFNTHMTQTMEKIKDPINDALSFKEKTVDQIISFDELLHSEHRYAWNLL